MIGKSFEEIMEHIKVLHKQDISEKTTAIVGQGFDNGVRSKVLFLILYDKHSGRWFSMKLKTWRSLLTFMTKKNFIKARRISFREKIFGELSQAEIKHKASQAKKLKELKKNHLEQIKRVNLELEALRDQGIHIMVDDNSKISGHWEKLK